jgi:hypothetical protein
MPSAFNVTATTNDVSLNASRQGSVALTIANISGKPQQGRVSIAALDSTKATWLSVGGGPDRAFPVGGAQQVTIQIAVPNDAAAGHYTFRPDVIAVQNPDEDSTQGPILAFEVPAPPPPPPVEPWWKTHWPILAAAAAAFVLIVGVVLFLFVFTAIVPNVVGQNVAAAQPTIVAAGFQAGTPTPGLDLTKPDGTVLDQVPAGSSRANRGSIVNLVVARSVVVPGVLNVFVRLAVGTISSFGLVPSPDFSCSSPINPFPVVIAESPPGGTRVAPGTTVFLSCR